MPQAVTDLFNLIIVNPMVNALLLLYGVFHDYGIAIIMFTILVAVITAPLRIKSQLSMRETQAKQAALKPKLDELKRKYKDNPQQLQAAQMKLYQEHGLANPLNAGCLLSILPFPIFIGLYTVITMVMGDRPESLMQLSTRLYPFLPQVAKLVPVNPLFLGLLNLSSTVSSLPVPLIAIIVGLVVGASFVQQKMMMMPTASLDPQQAQMNSSMQLMTPLLFAFFVFNYQVGLSLYWITFSLVGIVQQYFTTGWGGLFGQSNAPAKPQPKRLSSPALDNTNSSNGSEDGREQPTVVSAANPSRPKKGKKNRAKKS